MLVRAPGVVACPPDDSPRVLSQFELWPCVIWTRVAFLAGGSSLAL